MPSVRMSHSFLLIELSNKNQSVTSIHHFSPDECFGCGLKIILVQKYIRIIYIDLIKCSYLIFKVFLPFLNKDIKSTFLI